MKTHKYFLNSTFSLKLIAWLLSIYLKFVYFTTKWEFFTITGIKIDKLPLFNKTIVLSWHNKLAIMPYAMKYVKNLSILASGHSDGLIITYILNLLSINTINGSTNRNSYSSLQQIISLLKKNHNIGITPDGPKGPRQQINSNLLQIAIKYNAQVLPFGGYFSKCKIVNSWDKLEFPLPFAKAVIVVGSPFIIDSAKDFTQLNKELAHEMLHLDKLAYQYGVEL